MKKIHTTKTAIIRLTGFACLITLAVAGCSVFTSRPAAAAACTAPATSYGTATMQLSVPSAGTYRIWTHMYAPDTTNNSVLLEIDGTDCYLVGDSNIGQGAWTWVNHQNGSQSSKITATLSAGPHTVKVIGREPSVKLDRILAAADQNCTPAGLGDNCMASNDTTKPTVSFTGPADGSTVHGTVALKANASDNTAVNKVEFYVQNNLVATDTTAPYQYDWDTIGAPNGSYTLTATAYDSAGNSSSDSQAVIVKNGDSQAPSAPTALTGTAVSYNSVKLNWKASTDNSAVASYRVVRDNIVVATVNGLSYTDNSVVAGTTYNYYVLAVDNSNNVSPASNPATVVTPKPPVADTQPPSKPADLTATAAGTSQITVAWKPSTDNTGVKNYDLYRAQGNGTAAKIATTAGTSYGDGGLAGNTAYTYYVVARDAAGNSSPQSDKATATTSKQREDEGTGTLRGTVTGRNGRPLAGATVTIWVDGKRYQASTNWRGRYIMPNIPSGRYEASVRAYGYDRKTINVRIGQDKTKWQDISLRRR